jgi:hypothetical protein
LKFPDARKEELEKTMRSFDLETMVKKISRSFMVKKLMSKAMLDATKFNASDFSGGRLGSIGT